MLPLFAINIVPDVVKIQLAGLTLLAFAAFLLSGTVRPRAVERIYFTFAVLALIVVAYLAFGSWPAYAGTSRSYDGHAALWVITYLAVALFGALFFEGETFVAVIWRAAVLALWIGVITCAVSRVAGLHLLVNPADGALRMEGTLGEPSNWAPVLTFVLLLALRRREWLYAALAVAGLWLADSPTCILVMALTVPLWYGLCGSWRHRAVLLAALGLTIPAAVFFILHANPQAWEESGNPAEVAIGRLVSGMRNVGTSGQEGVNARFANTTGVIEAVRENGWMRLGAGPAADVTYFAAERLSGSGQQVAGVNALWVEVLVDFGETGVSLLGILLIVAAWRMRRFPEAAAILLSLSVASLVNSDIPDWSFPALAILVFGFGWAPGLYSASHEGHHGVTELAVPSPSR